MLKSGLKKGYFVIEKNNLKYFSNFYMNIKYKSFHFTNVAVKEKLISPLILIHHNPSS